MKTFLACLFVVLSACTPKNKSPYISYKTETTISKPQRDTQAAAEKAIEPTLLQQLDSLQLKKEDLRILIDKSDYKLSVLADTIVIKTYASVFGTNPIDDKLMQGDRSTPEGKFKVREFYPHKSWSKFIWIDYPNASSWKKHNRAKAENRIPQEATIGGEIGIHGVPANSAGLVSNKINWTWGCISLSNEDVNELYTIIYKSMPLEITK